MSNNNSPERRHYGEIPEIRAEGEDARIIEGYALKFNKESRVLGGSMDGFIEIIDKEALKEADLSDVIARTEHRNEQILARTSAGTLKLTVDDVGLRYRLSAPNTTAGNDTLENIRLKNIVGSSFAFVTAEGGDKWEKRDNKYYRTITNFKTILDVAPVVDPAYLDTDVKIAKRSIEQIEERESKQPAEVDLDIMNCKLNLLKLQG